MSSEPLPVAPAETMIRVTGVTKTYRLWKSPQALLEFISGWIIKTLLPPLRPWFERKRSKLYRDFNALKGVSLEVKRGETVGIVGRNGSGKSTLLQIVSGTLRPTSGEVEINGRVAALLELGSGFNPLFTGRENVHLNASILGLTNKQIEERFDAIVAFSEIGEFIDQPTKTYSSGMVVKLAFSVIAHVDADVLIVDEALAVGDARFQIKCARMLERFRKNNGTLLFVSHDMGSVKRLCTRAVLLDHGVSIFSGKPNDVANLYTKLLTNGASASTLQADIERIINRDSSVSEKNSAADEANAQHLAPLPQPKDYTETTERLRALEASLVTHPARESVLRNVNALLAEERRRIPLSDHEFSYGGEIGRILSVKIMSADTGVSRDWFSSGEKVIVEMTVESDEGQSDPIYAMTLKNAHGVEVYGTNTLFGGQVAPPLPAKTPTVARFSFALDVVPGDYFLSFGFTQFVGNELVIFHRRYDALRFEVHGVDRSFGVANLHARITVAAQNRSETKPAPANS